MTFGRFDPGRAWLGYRPRSPFDYLTPIPYQMRLAWMCLPEMGYCSAGERGLRCSCAITRENHDPGDEDRT